MRTPRISLVALVALTVGGCPSPEKPPPQPPPPSQPQPPSGPQRLVIDKIVMNQTPNSGTWLMCMMTTAGNVQATFNVPDKTYSGDGITIDVGTKLSPVPIGTTVNFRVYLDDDQADVCGGNAEDKSVDSFAAGDGSKTVDRDHFNYVVYYHME